MRPLQTRKLLAEDVADRIREEILSGGFGQGERLVEAGIAQQLGVSRGPVREAFKLLRAEGLVKEEPHRGTFVVRLTTEDVRDIYDLRAGLEARAARRVAKAGRPADLRAMHHLLDRLVKAAEDGDVGAVSQADLAFHEGVCQLSRNRRLHEVFVRHVPVMRNLMKLDEYIFRTFDQVAVEHEPLVAALDSGDPALAAERFEYHVERAMDQVAAYIDTLPDHS
jgi:GntR family transcriptional regulator, gluconate operon transcriptional repressor